MKSLCHLEPNTKRINEHRIICWANGWKENRSYHDLLHLDVLVLLWWKIWKSLEESLRQLTVERKRWKRADVLKMHQRESW